MLAGLIALLAIAPLPLGSNRAVAMATLVAATALLATIAAFGAWWPFSRDALSVGATADGASARLFACRWPLALLAGFVTLNWLQTLPLPGPWLAALSPESWRLQAGLGSHHLSMDVAQTRLYAALGTAYLTAYVLVVLLVRTPARLLQLARAIVYIGVAQAALGVFLFSAGARYHLLWFAVVHDRAKGSFSYHNQFAAFLALALAVGIGLLLAGLAPGARRPRQLRQWALAFLQFLLSPTLRLRLLLLVMVLGLVLTRSRMGNAGFLVALLVVGLLALPNARAARATVLALLLSVVLVDVAVVGSWIGLDRVTARLQDTTLERAAEAGEESVERREAAARAALRLVADFPAFGTGAGTFFSAFERYSPPHSAYYDHAHNDYVEFAADNGLIGLGLLGGFVLLELFGNLRALLTRGNRLVYGLAAASVLAVLSLALDSAVDFNLQCPADALLLVVILALGQAARQLPSGHPGGRA